MGKPEHDAPLVEIKALIARGRRRGFVTYDELNHALPAERFSSEQIEDTMARFFEMGVHVVEGEDGDDEDIDPVDVDPSSPQGPLPLRGEAEPEQSLSGIEAVGTFQVMPTGSQT